MLAIYYRISFHYPVINDDRSHTQFVMSSSDQTVEP